MTSKFKSTNTNCHLDIHVVTELTKQELTFQESIAEISVYMQTMALFSIACPKITQACEHVWLAEQVKPFRTFKRGCISNTIFDLCPHSNFLYTFKGKHSHIILCRRAVFVLYFGYSLWWNTWRHPVNLLVEKTTELDSVWLNESKIAGSINEVSYIVTFSCSLLAWRILPPMCIIVHLGNYAKTNQRIYSTMISRRFGNVVYYFWFSQALLIRLKHCRFNETFANFCLIYTERVKISIDFNRFCISVISLFANKYLNQSAYL